jgi:hypothetical protein
VIDVIVGAQNGKQAGGILGASGRAMPEKRQQLERQMLTVTFYLESINTDSCR